MKSQSAIKKAPHLKPLENGSQHTLAMKVGQRSRKGWERLWESRADVSARPSV